MAMFCVLIASVMLTSEASAGSYKFNIKVVNKSAYKIMPSEVSWKPKGSKYEKLCWVNSKWLSKGKAHKEMCTNEGKATKWQRQIRVTFTCQKKKNSTVTKTIIVNFPRNEKYFDRDHADKNNDTYTVKIKKSDC